MRATANHNPDTRTRILDAAERMFAAKGFAGTTLRDLVQEAEVNLASVGYYFGSKECLYYAVIQRMAKTIAQKQVEALNKLEKEKAKPSVEKILMAYVKPGIMDLTESSESSMTRAQLMSRHRTEAAFIQQKAAKEFSTAHYQFVELLKQTVPGQSEAELAWKLDMVETIFIRALTQTGREKMPLQNDAKEGIEDAVKQLISFATAGIQAGYQ